MRPLAASAVDLLVVVARVVVLAVGAPVLADDVDHGLLADGQDVEPEQHGPEAVLLADMVGAGAGALLAADGGLAGIEQVAEELPAGGRLEAGDAEALGDAVGGTAGRHRAGDALDAALVAGGEMGVGGEDGQAVGGGDEDPAADDQVAVAVAVRGGPDIGCPGAHHQVVELLGVDEVRVRDGARRSRVQGVPLITVPAGAPSVPSMIALA